MNDTRSAAEPTSTPPDELVPLSRLEGSDEERHWLQWFVMISARSLIVFSGLTCTVAYLYRAPELLLTALIIVLFHPVLLWGRRLAAQGRIERAATFIHSVLMIDTLLITLLVPTALPITVIGPIYAITFCLPCVSPARLRQLLVSTVITIGITTQIGAHARWFYIPLDVYSGIPLTLAVIQLSAISALLIWHYHNRFASLLSTTQRINRDLKATRAGLEATIVAHTADLREQELRFRTIAELTSDVMFGLTVDAAGSVTTRWSSGQLRLRTTTVRLDNNPYARLISVAHPEDRQILINQVDQLLNNVASSIELRLTPRGSIVQWIRLSARPEWSDAEQRTVGIFGSLQDISDRKRFEAEIDALAMLDPLTGLANRRLWLDQCTRALDFAVQSQEPVAVLYFDLDRFKTINDTLGHDIGDELLVAIAERLQACIEPDDLVARLGGDEFALLVRRADEPRARMRAMQVRAAMDPEFYLRGHTLAISLSIGIACAPRDGDALSILLQRADVAMYDAKKRGIGQQVYRHDLNAFRSDHLAIETELRHAINNSELLLHFQPILRRGETTFSHVEALVRWQHPSRGLVSPGVFIPIAEKSNLIRQLDAWVMRAALDALVAWDQARTPLMVSINLSATTLQDPDLVAQVYSLIERSGARPEQIVIEVTESAAMRDLAITTRVLQGLSALGVRIALDDFGSGYTSLALVKQLPVDVLKIDQSFVRGIGNDRRDEGVLESMVVLARGLCVELMAEGVEEQAQLQWLWQAGYHAVQGYLLSRPVSAATIDTLLGTNIQQADD